MSGRVNVVLPDGRVVSVDQETADASRLKQETAGQEVARHEEDRNEQAFGGVLGTAAEAAQSFGDTATFGGLGKLETAIGGDDWANAQQQLGERHGVARLGGELGAFLGGGAGALGATADVGEAVGQAAGKWTGRAVEGGLFGLGSHIADTNVTGDPLTIEGAVEGMGVGAILNMGAGLVVDKLSGAVESAATRSSDRLLEGNKLKAELETASQGAKTFGEPPPSWDEFRESHTAAQKAVGEYNREVERQTEAYHDFQTKNSGVGTATEKVQSVLNKLRNEALAASMQDAKSATKAFEDSPAWNEVRDLHNTAENDIGRANKVTQKANDAYTGTVNSNEELTGHIADAEKLIRDRRGLYSDNTKNPAQWIEGKPRSVQTATEMTEAGPVEKQILINQKPPITPELKAKYDAFDSRISDMYKKKAGGWKLNGSGAWEREASVLPDAKGALEDLRSLHKDLAREMPKGSGKVLRDLPAAPQELRTASGVKVPKRLTDMAALSDTQLKKLGGAMTPEAATALKKLAKDVGVGEGASTEETLRAIREKVRTGGRAAPIDPELAKKLDGFSQRLDQVRQLRATNPQASVEGLRGLQNDMQTEFRGAAQGLRDIPQVPLELKPELSRAAKELPKSLRDFAKKTPDTINQIANNIDPASAQAFERLAKDLGVEIQASPAETIAAVHRKLGEYDGALKSVSDKLRKKAQDEAEKPLLLKMLNKAARYAAARSVDFGGLGGAASRVLTGEAVGRGLDAVEGGVLGGELLRSKLGVRAKLDKLITKYGRPTAEVMRKLPPVTAYLGQSIMTGQRDPEKSIQKQAVNRINEIMSLQQTAPDHAYMALQGLLGHPGDLAWKMHQQIINTVMHLAQVAPKDPGIDVTMFGSNWQPALHDAIALAHRLEAALDPISSFARALGGDGHPAGTETRNACYPGLTSEFSQTFAMNAPELGDLTHQQAGAYSTLFGVPMSGLQNPIVSSTIQGLYLPKPPQQGPGGGGSSSTGNPAGRPAAVQSPVAGSSVSALTSQ